MSQFLDKINKAEAKLRDKPLTENEKIELSELNEKLKGATICVSWTKKNYQPSQREQLEVLRMMYQVVKRRMKKP